MAPDPFDEIRQTHRHLFRGAGGTPGGLGLFVVGFLLAGLGLYFLLDSVRVTSHGIGWVSGGVRWCLGGGAYATTSTGILFVPFILGVVTLFYDSRLKTGWGLLYFGLAIIVVEVLSGIQFFMSMKTTSLLLILGLTAAGIGLMLRSLRDEAAAPGEGPKQA